MGSKQKPRHPTRLFCAQIISVWISRRTRAADKKKPPANLSVAGGRGAKETLG